MNEITRRFGIWMQSQDNSGCEWNFKTVWDVKAISRQFVTCWRDYKNVRDVNAITRQFVTWKQFLDVSWCKTIERRLVTWMQLQDGSGCECDFKMQLQHGSWRGCNKKTAREVNKNTRQFVTCGCNYKTVRDVEAKKQFLDVSWCKTIERRLVTWMQLQDGSGCEYDFKTVRDVWMRLQDGSWRVDAITRRFVTCWYVYKTVRDMNKNTRPFVT